MAVQYISVPESSFERGIDVRSSENQISPGFVRDLLNADVVELRARKRVGYQGFAGNLPVRVTGLEYRDSENQVCFTLDSAVSLDSDINLESVRSTPLVVYGRSSNFDTGDGPFEVDTDHLKYYPGFSIPLRRQFTAPSGTLVVAGTETGFGTTDMFVGVVESSSFSNRSYSQIIADSISIDETSFDTSIGYTVSSDKQVFVYFADESTGGGENFTYAALGVGTGTQTISIPTGTHNLVNFNIVAQVQLDSGTSRDRVIPDSLVISSNGTVTVVVDNNTGSPQDYYVVLSAAPLSNVAGGNVGSGSTGTVVISNPERPWIFYGIYLRDGITGDLSEVIPDSLQFDDTTSEIRATFTNNSPNAAQYVVYYEYGNLRSNQLCVTDTSVTTDGVDSFPQLTIWGLDQQEIYGAGKTTRQGWVTHLDSYRRSAEERMVSGLGGNLFTARTYSEAATQYGYPVLFPNLNSRTSTELTLSPLFWNTGELPGRNRGYITADNSGTNTCEVSAVAYDSGSGWTKYTLSLPSKAILDSSGSPTSLSSVISTTSGLEDYLDVEGMSFSIHEGSYRIMQVVDGANEILVWVDNPNVNSSDFDDSGVAGIAGVFTDQLSWTAPSPYITGDILHSTALSNTQVYTVQSSQGDTAVVYGIYDLLQIANGVSFLGERSSSVIPMRSAFPSPTTSVTNLVRGDMISYTGIGRLLRVARINPDSSRTVSISGDGTTATVTLASGSVSYLSVGQSVLLTQAGAYSGVQQIVDILSMTSYSFSSSETATVPSATQVGATVEVDEQLDWQDSAGDTTGFVVEERWIPVEAPDDNYDLTPSTHVRYFDTDSYGNQPFLRSTMLASNMYFTNRDDEVYKFDGSNNYRAGLIPWQPGAFLTQEDTSGALIVTDLRSIPYTAKQADQGRLTITDANQNTFPIGSSIRLSGSSQTYTVRGYTQSATPAVYYLLVDRSLDSSVSATGSVSEIGVYRYYYRLNAVDANDNIVASAVTGFEDHIIELTGDAAVQHKLVGFPAWDTYDYDRLELQIYRTKINLPAPFYLVTTIQMDFDNTLGYISFRDSFADSDLTELDIVNTALKGSELGLAWSDPLRAKYITSIGNRLVLGNVRDYPQLDIQIVGDGTVDDTTFGGDSFLFRRDNTDSSTTTDNVNRVKFEWVDGTTDAASNFTIGTDQFSFDAATLPMTVAAGDWVYLSYDTVATTGRNPAYSGWWQIDSVAASTVTVNLVDAAAASSYPDKYTIATDSRDVPVLLGVDGNLGGTTGDFPIFDAGKRMAIAINAVMRMVDVSLTGQESFIPWLVAHGGNDETPAGHIVIRQPRSDSSTPEVVVTFSGYDLFVNSIRRATGDQVSASTRIYPSRILVSYENYPEIVDNPGAILDVDSDSAIDINPADGQEITGVIPFFGETAFTAAQQAAILVVFKTNSIYLVDLNQKSLGAQAVQRIETEGLGCTAPYSIAASKAGIMFANTSGLYCLRRTQAIDYVGRYMERNWTERVSLPNLDLVQGHHYGLGRSYKVSIPLATTDSYIENSEVYVYNHTGEDEGKLGAWSRYDNHPATGWANLAEDAYFSSTGGRVFSLRRAGDVTDFRDDSSPIDFRLDTRALDFGSPGIRKVIDRSVIHYRTPSRSTGTTVSYSLDLETEFSESTAPVIPHSPALLTGIDDEVGHEIETILHNVHRRRCVYFQLRVENDTLDESIEVAGLDFRVGGLAEKGILSAQNSRSK